LGWAVGSNLRIDTRWGAGDAERNRKYAAELLALAADVVVANGPMAVLSANRRVVRACWMSSLHRPTRTHLRLVHRTIARLERHSSATDRRAALLLLLPRHHLGKGALTASAMVNHRILSDESRHRLNFRLVQKTLSTVTPPVTRDEFWLRKINLSHGAPGRIRTSDPQIRSLVQHWARSSTLAIDFPDDGSPPRN
jgi:hypothetical protein